MGKNKHGKRDYRRARERNISVRGVRRDPPDVKKLSQALVALALARAESEAQAEHNQRGGVAPSEPTSRDREARDGE